MDRRYVPNDVHFVGSIALDTVPDVFRELGSACGRRLRRVPDGEPGGRRQWVGWQWAVLRASPYLAWRPPRPWLPDFVIFTLADGVDPTEIRFGELGYAREARSSYQDFLQARRAGQLPPEVKFQVSLPTPFATVVCFVDDDAIDAVLPAYQRAIFEEVGRICEAIPHHDLAIQWDVCQELLIWDGQAEITVKRDAKATALAGIVRCFAAVPETVEAGIHLCYGDHDAQHVVQPEDAGKAVELANRIVELSSHPLAWIHLPVPADRDDDEFFVPLERLEADGGTQVYLGLVHGDGSAAVQRRIAAAAGHLERGFGIATECGIARKRTPETVLSLIRAHAESSVEPDLPRSSR